VVPLMDNGWSGSTRKWQNSHSTPLVSVVAESPEPFVGVDLPEIQPFTL